jgi:hypothetical protein
MVTDPSVFPYHLAAGMFIFILLLILLASVFWLWMLVDAVRREYEVPAMKVVWVLAVFFGHLLGAVVYYFAGRETGRLPTGKPY